ncbi:MAG: transporter [Nitrospira sp.]|nr:transporter [Nitrospira sp.]MBH0183229.1 transporter [Nitrospira sp.]MBH0186103.1 transporter [Nitrospira sp.]
MNMGVYLRRCRVIVLTIIGCFAVFQPECGLAEEKEKMGPDQRPTSERNWQVGVTPSYSSGNFGTGTTSEFVYVPTSIRRLFREGDVTVVIPFVSVTSNGSATLVGGQPTSTLPDGCFRNSGTEFRSDKPECVAALNAIQGGGSGQKVTNSGLGDIILRGRYYAVEEKEYVPLIALTARIKVPTADEGKGLGTGALDHGYGVELSKMLGDKWIAFLDGGYNFLGDPNGRELQNQHWFDIGGGHYLTKSFLVSVYYEEYRAVVANRVNIRDVFFAFNYRASDAWRFNGGVTVGLSNGAPDYGVSLGTSYRF